MNRNITYRSPEILEFYRSHRQRWDELYPSERTVFERVAASEGSLGRVLDVGCACGGLGSALEERFALSSYTGVDIHQDSVDWATANRRLTSPARFFAGDILEVSLPGPFDTVASLGCADWNVETGKILDACWSNVAPGGSLIVSLRLTPAAGVNDPERSYQFIDFSGTQTRPERANYVVFNVRDAVGRLRSLAPGPAAIGVHGYWGKPSSTAVTPFTDLIFSVFYIRKSADPAAGDGPVRMEVDLPPEGRLLLLQGGGCLG